MCSTHQSLLIDAGRMDEAERRLKSTGLVIETPMLTHMGKIFNLASNISLFLKLENMQTNGFN